MSKLDDVQARFESDGYVVLEGLLSKPELGEIVRALDPFERDRPMGRNDFEGERSQRVYSLAGKGRAFLDLAEHPMICGLLDRLLMPNWLLSTFQSIRLHPGETAQPWHADDSFYPLPRPRTIRLAASVIWAIEDFTVENGATELAVGSHLWGDDHPDDHRPSYVQATMPAGSAVVFDGALWHRGQANVSSTKTRLAISPQYCQPFLRTQESQLLIVPPDAAATASERARSMLGYSIHPPFVGQVNGMHPLRLVDAEYAKRKTGDRHVANRLLARPEADMTTALRKS